MGNKVSRSIARVAEDRETGSENNRIEGEDERSNSREEIGVIVEAMVIYPNPHTPKMDSGSGRARKEVGWCEHGFLERGK